MASIFSYYELDIKLRSFLVIVAYAIDFVRLNVDVDLSLLAAFDLSIWRLCYQSYLNLLGLPYMPWR